MSLSLFVEDVDLNVMERNDVDRLVRHGFLVCKPDVVRFKGLL